MTNRMKEKKKKIGATVENSSKLQQKFYKKNYKYIYIYYKSCNYSHLFNFRDEHLKINIKIFVSNC